LQAESEKKGITPQVTSPCNEDDLARAFYHFEGEPGGRFPQTRFLQTQSIFRPIEKKLAPIRSDTPRLAVVARLEAPAGQPHLSGHGVSLLVEGSYNEHISAPSRVQSSG
jgi:hypothetical protein